MSVLPTGVVPSRHSENDRKSYELTQRAFEESALSTYEKLEAFPRFIPKRSLTPFLCKYEIYKKIVNVNGVIIECGVFNGGGLFTWAHLVNIFEPANYTRKIIGFDTFEGFPDVEARDSNQHLDPKKGDLRGDQMESIQLSIEKYNYERHLSHIPNIELIKGDFNKTAEPFLKENPYLLVAMLYLDFDLYEPTCKALEVFLPRMAKGSIICCDELNCPNFPGETLALLDSLNIKDYRINRFPFNPWISYIEL